MTRTYGGVEYEIRFNGVNDGHDGDLLVDAAKQPEKRAGGPMHAGYGAARDRVREALPWTRLGALRFAELVTLSGCTSQAVNSTLYTLRKLGLLCSEPVPGTIDEQRIPGRPRAPQVYWRRA